jgi:hypothetical protein
MSIKTCVDMSIKTCVGWSVRDTGLDYGYAVIHYDSRDNPSYGYYALRASVKPWWIEQVLVISPEDTMRCAGCNEVAPQHLVRLAHVQNFLAGRLS